MTRSSHLSKHGCDRDVRAEGVRGGQVEERRAGTGGREVLLRAGEGGVEHAGVAQAGGAAEGRAPSFCEFAEGVAIAPHDALGGIRYRCKDLGIISQPTLSGVFKVFGVKKWRKNEPNALPKERPSRFERLCIRALAEDVISEAKAFELLKKTIREVVDSLARPPEDAIDGHAAAH